MYAEVAVNAPVRNTFHYHIPHSLQDKIRPGHLVRVAFGTAAQHGIVIALHDSSPIEQTKPIEERLDPQPVVTAEQIALAQWMSRRYLAPLGDCLWLMLPPGLTVRGHQYTLLDANATREDSLEARIVDLLRRRGPLRDTQIRLSLRSRSTQKALDALVKAEVLGRESVIAPPRVRPKTIQTAMLAIPPEQILNIARHLGKKSRRADLLEVIAALSEEEFAPVDLALRLAETTAPTLKRLAEAGLVAIEEGARGDPPLVMLDIPRESLDEALIELRGGEAQLAVLERLARQTMPLDVKALCAQTGATLHDLKRLAEDDLILLDEAQVWRDSLARREFVLTVPPRLTPEQESVWREIEAGLRRWQWMPPSRRAPDAAALPGEAGRESGPVFLLHGVTGSGKTEIYLQAIELALAQGRQAIFLVPEIALTPQTVRRVAERFPGQVAVVHGSLSAGERYDTWRRARAGQIQVVVGARSALFTPLPDVGLVILDEEHDHSYKQSPPISPPYYHARAVAEQMMRQNNGVLILGSATPDVTSMYRAQRGDIAYLHLPSRIMGHRETIRILAEETGLVPRYAPLDSADALTIDLPPVQVVDMRHELKSGNTGIFSRELHDALALVLERGEQAMLYLNRRGQSTYVFCRDCGYIEACPRCDTPLTYHRYGEALRCHHCGYQKGVPQICPQCQSRRIKFFGAGTQQVEAELRKQFPQARVLRWDADTASRPEMHDMLLQRFIHREADVMVGTQMIAKGLDLPLVTLVGVVSADLGLALPDFRAGERVFQLLTQVAGRAGRGLLGGRVILQTYQPDNYAIAAAAEHDYERFYRIESEYRRQLGYPPFRGLARIVFSFPVEAKAQAEAERAANLLRARMDEERMTGTEIIGPAPCFFTRIDKQYRWHVLLRGPDPAAALEDMPIARGWYLDIDPVDVL